MVGAVMTSSLRNLALMLTHVDKLVGFLSGQCRLFIGIP